MFRWYTNEFKYNVRDKLDITEVIDIFTCEDISSHVRISYRFYQFVTTRYTTDFYIIIWNNKDIRIDNKPIFYKTFFESGITHITDLRFDLDIIESYNIITKNMKKANILVWAGLRHPVPFHLISKSKTNNRTFLTMPPSLNIDNVFDILMKKSKDYYTKLISKKAKFSNNSFVLKRDISLNEDQLSVSFAAYGVSWILYQGLSIYGP